MIQIPLVVPLCEREDTDGQTVEVDNMPMRRGCIAVAEVICDKCGRTLQHPDRYLSIEDGEKTFRYCVQCATKLGYASTKTEKGEQVVTFFGEE